MIIALAGPSGAGKTTFINRSVEAGVTRTLTPVTTRVARPGEIEGHDYHFTTKDDFRARIVRNEFVDWDYTIGNYYGYPKALANHAVSDEAVTIAVVARMAVRLRAKVPHVKLVFLDDVDEELARRMSSRLVGDTDAMLRRWHDKEEREHAPLFDFRYRSPWAISNVQLVVEAAVRATMKP